MLSMVLGFLFYVVCIGYIGTSCPKLQVLLFFCFPLLENAIRTTKEEGEDADRKEECTCRHLKYARVDTE